jgi:hypothetical protein
LSPICSNCPKKNSCRELCKENEVFTNQDHVRRREKLLHDLEPGAQPGKWQETGGTTETILKLYFVDRKTTKETAEIVFVSDRYVRKIVAKYKPIIAQNIKKSVPLRHI